MHVDEAMAGQPEQLAEIDHAFDVLKLRGLYFNVDSLSRHGFPWPLDAPQMEPFWDKIARGPSCASSSAPGRATTGPATWRTSPPSAACSSDIPACACTWR